MDWTTITVAFIGFLGIFSGAYFGYLGQHASRQVNDAVNNRHKDHPKLYDLVVSNHENIHTLGERMAKVELLVDTLPCQSEGEGDKCE